MQEPLRQEPLKLAWADASLHRLSDRVLLRNAGELRWALLLLERYGATGENEYVEYMQRGLRAMEAELARRGLCQSASCQSASCEEERLTGAEDERVRSRLEECVDEPSEVAGSAATLRRPGRDSPL